MDTSWGSFGGWPARCSVAMTSDAAVATGLDTGTTSNRANSRSSPSSALMVLAVHLVLAVHAQAEFGHRDHTDRVSTFLVEFSDLATDPAPIARYRLDHQ